MGRRREDTTDNTPLAGALWNLVDRRSTMLCLRDLEGLFKQYGYPLDLTAQERSDLDEEIIQQAKNLSGNLRRVLTDARPEHSHPELRQQRDKFSTTPPNVSSKKERITRALEKERDELLRVLTWLRRKLRAIGFNVRLMNEPTRLRSLTLSWSPTTKRPSPEEQMTGAVAADLVAWIGAGHWNRVRICAACGGIYGGRPHSETCSAEKCKSEWRRSPANPKNWKSVKGPRLP